MKTALKQFYFAALNLIKVTYAFIIRVLKIDAFFKFRNVFEIIGAYFLAVVIILFCFAELPFDYNSNAPTIAIYGTPDRIGESMLYERTVAAAKKNGWNVISASIPEIYTRNAVGNHFSNMALSIVNYIYKPKFNFHTTHHIHLMPHGYNVTYLNVPNDMIIDRSGDFQKPFAHLADYDAYVDLYSVTNGSNPELIKALAKHNKTAPIIPLYIVVNLVKYSPAVREKSLIVGSLWGANRESLRVFNALKKLADEGLLVAYGLNDYLKDFGDNYKGRVEEFSKSSAVDNLLKIQKQYGVSIAIHNLEHMIENIPTNRISESINAGAIVICDDHGFVRKYFGDTVLYINTIASSDSIYRQIKAHMDWIRKNPTEVEKKTKAAHAILTKNFVLETSLKKLYNIIDAQRQLAESKNSATIHLKPDHPEPDYDKTSSEASENGE